MNQIEISNSFEIGLKSNSNFMHKSYDISTRFKSRSRSRCKPVTIRCQHDPLQFEMCSSDNDRFTSSNTEDNTMILPIFPLRKRVKFPTESIQLTLWEERYKSLAQSVLNQKNELSKVTNMSDQRNDSISTKPTAYEQYHTFGILYASHKPQIIRDGSEPITPMIECGDVGVLCVVREYSLFQNNEEIINVKNYPLISNENDPQPIVKKTSDWNKIRLVGLGIERFIVEEIIQNGYKDGHKSFIAVKARKINDRVMVDSFSETSLQQHKRLLEDCFDGSNLLRDLKEFQVIDRDRFQRETSDSNYLWKSYQDRSFALMSTLETGRPAVELLNMLASTSLEERFQYITRFVAV